MTISEKVVRIKEMQARLQAELLKLQLECEHPNATGKYGSSTGNWCPQDDSYWIEAECPDCGKRWWIDSATSVEEYRTFKGAK